MVGSRWQLRREPRAPQKSLRQVVPMARIGHPAAIGLEMEVAMEWRNERVCDVLNLVLGALLFFSPWIFGFAPGAQSQNAMISGFIIAVLSVAALAAFAEWEEWLNLVVGLWVLVSPWVLEFANTTAMWVHIVIGIIVAVVAAIEVWMMRHGGRLMPSR
jgi:hypothetical protein